jgi:hypothetical protein
MRPRSAHRNWFSNHWHGHTSLGIAYWINGLLLGNMLPALALVGFVAVNPFKHSLRANALVTLVLRVVQLAIWIWGITGILRSANRHTSVGGTLFWANAARLAICVGILVTAYRYEHSIIPGLRVTAAIAAGHDPMERAKVETINDGNAILLSGSIGEGSVQEVQSAIDASPRAITLILNSRGGRTAEAEEIALRVRQKHLDTQVQDRCLSACTYIFLAGLHRSAADTAALGFHQPSFPGLTTEGQKQIDQQMVEYYRSVGVRDWFIDRVMATPSKNMWFPTRRELENAGVLSPEESG